MRNSFINGITVPEFCRMQVSLTSFCISTFTSFSSKTLMERIWLNLRSDLGNKYGQFKTDSENSISQNHRLFAYNQPKRMNVEIFQKSHKSPITVKVSRWYDYSDTSIPEAFREFRDIQNILMVLNRKIKITALKDEIFDIENTGYIRDVLERTLPF